jgi:trypsin
MRRILPAVLLFLCTLPALAQKVTVQIVKFSNAAEASWEVMDEAFNPVFASDEYFSDDSIATSLEANKRYLLSLSVSKVFPGDTVLCRLYINSEPLLLIGTGVGPGDHFYYFFTGVRQEATKITGGTDTNISSFPWQVYLESGNFTCGGSIISGDWIITAAHCTEDDFGNLIPASQMAVTVGANDPAAGEGKRYLVSQVIRHEKYNSNTLLNDIALLKLTQTINYTNATPIRLVSENDSAAGATDPGVLAWVTGYGLTRVSPPAYPSTLQKVQLPIVTNAQASVVWTDIPVTDVMAGYLNGGKDACAGDSGGPLVVPVAGQYKLAGIVSWGSSNCNTYGAYTRVSIFASWISSKTGIEINFKPPVPSGDSIVCPGISSSDYSISPVTGATAYEWQLQPSGAGTVEGISNSAVVTWNKTFRGKATVMVRVTRNNNFSDWSVLYVQLANNTKIVSQSGDTVLCAGQPVILNVNSEGYNLVYSWFRNDTLLKKGTSSLVNLNSTVPGNSGIYQCDIIGSCGSASIVPLTLTVYPVTRINKVTRDSEVAFGGSIDLSVEASGHDLTYQWLKGGSDLHDSINPAISLKHVNAGNTGLYSVTVNGTCGTVESGNIYVYVRRQDFKGDPEVFIWPSVTSSGINVAVNSAVLYNILVFNTSGRLIVDRKGCQYTTRIDLSGFAAGIYIVKVYNDNFKKSLKVIRE